MRFCVVDAPHLLTTIHFVVRTVCPEIPNHAAGDSFFNASFDLPGPQANCVAKITWYDVFPLLSTKSTLKIRSFLLPAASCIEVVTGLCGHAKCAGGPR